MKSTGALADIQLKLRFFLIEDCLIRVGCTIGTGILFLSRGIMDDETGPSNDEPIFKRYVYPNGELLELTRSEFDRVVDVFRMLHQQDLKTKRLRSEGRTPLTAREPESDE